jgi:hypothetical protein
MEFLNPSRQNASATTQGRGRTKSALRIGTLIAWAITGLLTSFGQSFHEKEVQAVFVFNFAQFTEWPSTVFPDADTPITIGILGSDAIRPHLEKALENETVHNRKVILTSYRKPDEIPATCHILFIGRSESANVDSVLLKLKRRSILTVSDIDNFANRGGIIQFRTERNRIRLVINNAAARSVDLNISSKLLRLADVVSSLN